MMLFLSLAFAALTLTGWAMLVRAAGYAPEGIEDEAGFHLVNPALEIDTKTRGDAAMSVFLRNVLDRESMPVL